ncbi:MAG: hypothetical protein AAF984_10825, partial [Verrucomicrobiota bacterium]
ILIVIVCAIAFSFFYGGCHNLFTSGEAEISTSKDLELFIRSDIQDELNLLSPSGYKTKPYSREIWNLAWNGHIDIYHDHTFVDEPESARRMISLIINERRSSGLSELLLDENSLSILRDLDLLHLIEGGEN